MDALYQPSKKNLEIPKFHVFQCPYNLKMAERLTLEGTTGDDQAQPLICQNTSGYNILVIMYM